MSRKIATEDRKWRAFNKRDGNVEASPPAPPPVSPVPQLGSFVSVSLLSPTIRRPARDELLIFRFARRPVWKLFARHGTV